MQGSDYNDWPGGLSWIRIGESRYVGSVFAGVRVLKGNREKRWCLECEMFDIVIMMS